MEKLIHLLGAGQARFIQDVEPFLVDTLFAAKMTLQSPGFNTGLLQFVSRARGWCEASHFISFSLSGPANRAQGRSLAGACCALDRCDFVLVGKYLLHRGALAC